MTRLYYHLLYSVHPRPPYELQAFSLAFRLPPLLHNRLDDTQYCAGARPRRGGRGLVGSLQLTYGAGDCAAASVDIPLPLVRQLLGQQGATIDRVHHKKKYELAQG